MRNLTFAFKQLSLSAIFLLFTTVAFAQKAIIAGKAVDKETGEMLIGATVTATTKTSEYKRGAITDLDGNYSFEVEPGTYVVSISYPSYQTKSVEDFPAKVGNTNVLDFEMGENPLTLEVVVVKATQVKNTDASLISMQKNSLAVLDGISYQQISRTGSASAAEAIKQMPGAVMEGGKYVVMRGLGDRYSLSQLNGVTMPSTDPYRNSTSLDLIPAQMIENITTLKTFTPDQPGNFSGGLVNVTTKSFPDRFTLYLGVSSSINTQSNFINDFNGHGAGAGGRDWLGFDDGTRALPSVLQSESNRALLSQNAYLDARNPSRENDGLRQLLNESSRSLSNVFTTTQKSTPVNHGINFSVGDKKKLFGNTLGYTLGLNYSREFAHYENADLITRINSRGVLQDYQALKESKSTETPHLGALFNLSYKLGENNALRFNMIYNNDADIIGRNQSGSWPGQLSIPNAEYITNSLEFIQRQFVSYQLSGKHVFPKLKNAELEWTGSSVNSFQKDPDSRFLGYIKFTDDDGNLNYAINEAEFKPPFHFFRDLQDQNQEFKVDFTLPFKTGSTNHLKMGALYNRSTRDFSEFQFQHNRNPSIPSTLLFNSVLSNPENPGDVNSFFSYDNFGIIDTLFSPTNPRTVTRYVPGYYYINNVNNKNFYNGFQNVAAGYVMAVGNVLPRLKAIGGLRVEATDLQVQSRDTSIAKSVIDLIDFLPSANLIYAISPKSNLRAAFTRTLARPNMRELAPFEQFDTKNGFFNVGNPNLQRTLISNYDLRYEIYPNQGELIAVSAFYKRFENPILRTFIPTATIPELGYLNVDAAQVYGLELEVRRNLSFLGAAPLLSNLYFSTNLALIQSSYDIPQVELEASRMVDPAYDLTTRPFQSQAPYIVNVAMSYINPDRGWEATLSYNESGRKLYNIGQQAVPDVFEERFPLLNFNMTKRFAEHFQFSFSARNLLNPINKKTQRFNGEDFIADSFTLGRTFGVGLSYFIR
jgi:TonB-dependent receptor